MCWSFLLCSYFLDPSSQFGFRIRSPFSVFQTLRKVTREWSDGVAAELIRNATRDNHNPATWLQWLLAMICIGGPLDRWFNSIYCCLWRMGFCSYQLIDFCFWAKIWVDGRRAHVISFVTKARRRWAGEGLTTAFVDPRTITGSCSMALWTPCGLKVGKLWGLRWWTGEEFGQFVSSLKFDVLNIYICPCFFTFWRTKHVCVFFGGGGRWLLENKDRSMKGRWQ